MEIDSQTKPFIGVRFVLFGFDSINERQVRSKLIDGGGVDVGLYSKSCTHVIVDNIVLDDPVCAAARTDGKTLVSSLWVDHSFDIGMPVDATSIMYRPPKDLNGIPGAKSLVVCLTGYQRQDREDIMTMVGLMGAQFSKPLVANKVTHLICYKFEGEKYELAKKIKMMKLVNHRWLEDCLRDWELLPEANYNKSGYELETLEAEAKDSEEEAEDSTLKQFGEKDSNMSPNNLKFGIINARTSPKSAKEVPKMLVDSTVPECSSGIDNAMGKLSTPGRVSLSHQVLSFDNVNVPEVNGSEYTGALSNILHEKTPNSMKVGVDLASTLKNTEIASHSGSKFSSMSYSRKKPRKSTVSASPGMGCKDVRNVISYKVENEESRTATDCGETMKRGAEAYHEEDSSAMLPQKRMNDDPGASSKSPKMNQNAKSCNLGSQINHKMPLPENKSSVFQSLNNHSSPGNNDYYTDLNTVVITHASRTNNSSAFNKKTLTSELPSFKTVIPEALQGEGIERKSPETSLRRSKESMIANKAHTGDFGMRSVHVVGEQGNLQNQRGSDVSSAKNRLPDVDKSPRHVNMDSLQRGNNKLIAKPFRKKMVAKKSVLKHTANQKGSIYSKKVPFANNPAVCLTGGEERGNREVSTTNELEAAPSTASNEAAKEVNMDTVTKFGDDIVHKAETMDDETETPDDEDELQLGKALNDEKSEVVEFTRENTMVTRIAEVGCEANDFNVCRHDEVTAKEGMNTEQGTTNSGKTIVDESASERRIFERKTNEGKRRLSSKANTEAASADKETVESKKDLVGEGAGNRNKNKEEDMEKKNNVLHHRSKSCHPMLSANKFESSVEAEKENRPNADVGQTSNLGVGKSVLQSMKVPMKINKSFEVVNFDSTPTGKVLNRLKDEPVWFILSGHRLQRKEFQQVIRRLKGRYCRDSHQWSYQATHFVAPDPVRRTEKFFAAAASGRWILKTDYLSACSQAGKFLPEEPYEWHKNGLSEDGAINLEAPRKWRLFKERTGRGAFHGMRIIVYGDCIAPPLDTLKRVVKAGDGNILATSPPYTRFLKSGVDFAVVSPGMPRVDKWVQEFLKHEIPCVVADYLVEFVCKPGYSLERHVLYSTHSWAEKSLANMLSKAEETDLTPPNDHDTGDTDDITCQVCGCSDRGEVMLICGTENGSVGCGVGTHIDCCDPPLQNIPEEDWFCPKCTRSRINPPNKRKKGSSSRKRK